MKGHVQENRLETRGKVLHDIVEVQQTGYVLLLPQPAVNLLDANFAAFYLTNFELLKVDYILLAEIFKFENLFARLLFDGFDDIEIRRRS